MDVKLRKWSKRMLDATELTRSQMPEIREGSEIAGRLRDELAYRWGLPIGVPIAAGGGDNAAGTLT